MSWNAQSIHNYSKIFELQNLVDNESIDVVCLQETYLDSNRKLFLQNFVIFRNDRDSRGGGVAIAVRKNLACNTHKIYNTKSIENISVLIKTSGSDIIITTAYSPKHDSSFEEDVLKMMEHTQECFIFGDLNAKHTSWDCRVNNKAGLSLFKLQNTTNFMIFHPLENTHFPHSGASPSCIDLLVSNTSHQIDDLFVHEEGLSSDHRPVICTIKCEPSINNERTFNFSHANWKRYSSTISNDIENFTRTGDIDTDIQFFIDAITHARDVSIPKNNIRTTEFSIDSETAALIKYKNQITRRWQRCGDPYEKTCLKSLINRAQKLIAERVNKHRNARWENFLTKINQQRFWQLTRSLRGKRNGTPQIIKGTSGKLTTNKEKAIAFAESFVTSHSLTSSFSHPNDRAVSNFMNRFDRRRINQSEIAQINPSEITDILRSIRPFKAPGEDQIVNILLKKLPPRATEFLSDIFNDCFDSGFWPNHFRNAKVVAIPKPHKNGREIQNYRPISLLNSVGKIFEKMVLNRITKFADDNNLFNPNQFGFRNGHSTTHQALRVTNHIRENKLNRRSTGLVLLDVEKAFDSVWHSALIYKLANMNFPVYICKIIQSFCSNRSFRVHVGESCSNKMLLTAGLPQGSVLSPTLFSLFISDLRIAKSINTAFYADDTALYFSANRTKTIINHLQNALDEINEYSRKWRIKINAAKTQAIVFPFNQQRKRRPTQLLRLAGTDIHFSSSVKYLGICLDGKLNFAEHVQSTAVKGLNCIRSLYPLLARRSKLSTINKLRIYKAIIRPIITYASPVWLGAASTHIKKLQVLQNKCLKMAFNLHWRHPTAELHEKSDFPLIGAFINEFYNKFIVRCELSDHESIRRIAENL